MKNHITAKIKISTSGVVKGMNLLLNGFTALPAIGLYKILTARTIGINKETV
jgi:hypothetical protein